MNLYSVLLTELGIIITNPDGMVERAFEFDDPVHDYVAIKSGTVPRLSGRLKDHIRSLESVISVVDEALLVVLGKMNVDCIQKLEGRERDDVVALKPQLMIDAGFVADQRDLVARLREFAIGLSSSKVTEVSGSADLHVIQAVNSLDEVDKVANALSSRVREWYGLHFPELENIVDGLESYSRIVMIGRRELLTAESFENSSLSANRIEMIILAASRSRGADISDDSLALVQSMARQMIALYEARRKLEVYIEAEMVKIAPNLAVILGTSLSARMLARVGSIKKMAALPASTMQVLGAERALFRSMKTGSAPPKHGILFQHALVHAAPRWQRGKIARAIAAKAVIAARVDVYGSGLNEMLLEKLNVRVGEIGEKFEKPPEPDGDKTYDDDDNDNDSSNGSGHGGTGGGFKRGRGDRRRGSGSKSSRQYGSSRRDSTRIKSGYADDHARPAPKRRSAKPYAGTAREYPRDTKKSRSRYDYDNNDKRDDGKRQNRKARDGKKRGRKGTGRYKR